MDAKEIQKTIKDITSNDNCGIRVFTLLQHDKTFEIEKFQINQNLQTAIKDKVVKVLTENYLNEEFSVSDIHNLAENKKTYYSIKKSEFNPFSFLDLDLDNLECYKENEQINLKGFFIKINLNDSYFWIYQHKYPVTLINRDSSIFAILKKGDVYEPLDCDVVKFDSNVDFLILNDCIISKNINLLQTVFGFETYIRDEAKKVIEKINGLDLISDSSFLSTLANQTKLTISKKLMKVKESPVYDIPKSELLLKIQKHPFYSKELRIDLQIQKILISSKKEAINFIKMLNDTYLESALTGKAYESESKELIGEQTSIAGDAN